MKLCALENQNSSLLIIFFHFWCVFYFVVLVERNCRFPAWAGSPRDDRFRHQVHSFSIFFWQHEFKFCFLTTNHASENSYFAKIWWKFHQVQSHLNVQTTTFSFFFTFWFFRIFGTIPKTWKIKNEQNQNYHLCGLEIQKWLDVIIFSSNLHIFLHYIEYKLFQGSRRCRRERMDILFRLPSLPSRFFNVVEVLAIF